MNVTESSKKKVLHALKTSEVPLSTYQISKISGLSRHSVQVIVKLLFKEKIIDRKQGYGNSWCYLAENSGVTMPIVELPPAAPPPSLKKDNIATKKFPLVRNKQLQKFLKEMSTKRWTHPVFQSEVVLSRNVLRLFNLAFEASTGGDIKEEDLSTIKETLKEFSAFLGQLKDFTDSIINEGQIWDTSTFYRFLCENYTPQEIRDLVIEARKFN